jgi:hypothetical protein
MSEWISYTTLTDTARPGEMMTCRWTPPRWRLATRGDLVGRVKEGVSCFGEPPWFL